MPVICGAVPVPLMHWFSRLTAADMIRSSRIMASRASADWMIACFDTSTYAEVRFGDSVTLAVAGAVEHLKSFLLGKNPMQIERLWQEMFRGGFFPAGNITTSAIAAMVTDLLDN